MKSEHERDADLSEGPASDANANTSDAPSAATEQEELSDEQIATITAGAAATHVTSTPPPMKIGTN